MTNLPAISPPSAHEGQQMNQWLQFLIAVAQVVGAFAVGYFTHILQCRRESKSRVLLAKNEFLAVVADQRAKFATIKLPGGEFFLREAEFFDQSVPVFMRAVYGIQRSLPAEQWSRLHAVLQEYLTHHKSEFEGGIARIRAAAAADLGTGQTHGQLLSGFLDRFEQCIHKRT